VTAVKVADPVSLICIPFAGAGKSLFRDVAERPSDTMRIVPVELPGHEKRFMEDFCTTIPQAVAAVQADIEEEVARGGRVALFGHSLGAIIAFEVARALESGHAGRLVHVFVSGSPGPWMKRDKNATGVPDDEFVARVEELAGYRHPALRNAEMREVMLPVLRADVAMHESYVPGRGDLLTVPLTSMRGDQDELVPASAAAEWAAATTGPFRLATLAGGHIYFEDSVGGWKHWFDFIEGTLARQVL